MAENSMSFLELPYKILPMWNPNFLSTLTSCYSSQQCDRGVYLLSLTQPMSLHMLLLLPGRFIPLSLLATSDSSLRPIQSHLPCDTSQTPACCEVELISTYISATYILCTSIFAFTTLHCGTLFISLSYLTASTTEGLDRVNSFSYSQHLAECLILSKCMLDYK